VAYSLYKQYFDFQKNQGALMLASTGGTSIIEIHRAHELFYTWYDKVYKAVLPLEHSRSIRSLVYATPVYISHNISPDASHTISSQNLP